MRLEHNFNDIATHGNSNFNSIKVRLELVLKNGKLYPPNFNSIKVRLELREKRVAAAFPVFQFHKGAIRTT